MHTTKLAFLIALVLPALAAAYPQTDIADPGAKQICAGVKEAKLPDADRPSADEIKTLNKDKCSSEQLYYGFTKEPDYVAARKCAYAEIERGEKDMPFAGRTILMMVYANGNGAERNYDVALRLACEVGGAPGDVAGRIHELDRMRQTKGQVGNFSVCGHSAGRFMYEQCALLDDRFDKIEREKKLERVQAHWDREEKAAFRSLRFAAARFFKLRATKETDLNVTFEVQEMALLENTFIRMVDEADRGDIPKATADDLKTAETDLSAAYAKTQAGKLPTWGTVTPEDIKNTQLAWTSYRDMWIAFGKKKYPDVATDSWKTWLDKQRREMLEKFMH